MTVGDSDAEHGRASAGHERPRAGRAAPVSHALPARHGPAADDERPAGDAARRTRWVIS